MFIRVHLVKFQPARSLLLAAVVFGALFFAAACKKAPPGSVDLAKLGLDEKDDLLFSQAPGARLPKTGEDYLLVVSDLGTCLECKKAAISLSEVWKKGSKPGRLVFLDFFEKDLDEKATLEFIDQKALQGDHFACRSACIEDLAKILGHAPALPSHYYVAPDGLVHWQAGYQETFKSTLAAIRRGRHDAPPARPGGGKVGERPPAPPRRGKGSRGEPPDPFSAEPHPRPVWGTPSP